MTDDAVLTLRQDTRDLFYHGYSNYLVHAFPEDELKPLSCKPQTRNHENPADIGLNDVLGNYSLTLIDSLSTLAILASAPAEEQERDGHDALQDFQRGVQAVVDLYGDGRNGSCGSRACGFDLDSKVQVFETNIRGVGGLLSAHLFAMGELPIRGYNPTWLDAKDDTEGIRWNGFVYDRQLLRLAHDLALRLLPAFSTSTDIPYPRVNLRYGIPFYQDAEGVCRLDGTSSNPREITETCAAGAGSLVLEFTTLSRLTGDGRFEELAKKAFWAVWNRRSAIGLLAGGIDAESGQWIMPPLAGIGAGIDSFFEYALKSHILLSNLPCNTTDTDTSGPELFLDTWNQAHAAVKRHVYRSSSTEKHPFYGQSDLITGAPRYSWIDNLSGYYPGLLALAGELEEAVESHLLYSALWTRYSALPERWHAAPSGFIDPNFRHWAGRPEFIESTYYLYQATKDPWYLHVGEMALRDIRRRCWTPCGWADLGDVVSGEQRDRMESFFLGETAKYLYLLLDAQHPLNHLDAPVVFTTEGHPLVIPKIPKSTSTSAQSKAMRNQERDTKAGASAAPTCPAPPPPLPLTVSNVANRADLFHAAALAQLHLVPINPSRSSPLLEASSSSPGISMADIRSPTNYTFYPWTLPQSLIPAKGMSSPIRSPVISTLTFPHMNAVKDGPEAEKGFIPFGALQKVLDGVLVNSLSDIRLNMVQEPRSLVLPDESGLMVNMEAGDEFRVHGIANWALGRDEKVLVSGDAMKGVWEGDPHFTRVKDLEGIDFVIDVPAGLLTGDDGDDEDLTGEWEIEVPANGTLDGFWSDLELMFSGLLSGAGPAPDSDLENVAASPINGVDNAPTLTRQIVPAILPTGAGAAPLPTSLDEINPLSLAVGQLPIKQIFFLDDTLCTTLLPTSVAKSYSVLVIKRGECSFNQKLARISSFVPSSESLQLVIILSVPEAKGDEEMSRPQGRDGLIRPLLDEAQKTPHGLERRYPIAMAMVDGTEETIAVFRRLASCIGTFDGSGQLVETQIPRVSGQRSDGTGLGVKRRYWFESMGVPIGNLIML